MGHCFQTVLEVGSLFKNTALSVESDIITCFGAWGGLYVHDKKHDLPFILTSEG